MIEVTLHLQTREGSRAIPLTTDQLKIGRGEEVDLRLDDDGLALRQATIYREGERVWLVDETSVSRTQVNHRDVPAAGISLTDGDEVRLGHHSRLWVSIKRNAGSRTKIKHPVVPSQTVSSRPFLVAAVLTVVMVIGLGAYIHSNSDRVPIPETTSPSPTVTINITPSPTPTTVSTFIPPPPNLYRDKNDDAAKLIYVEEKAQAIARIMSSDQGTYRFTPEALKSIMRYVNGYAGRLRGTGGEMVVEDCQRGKFITAPRATWKDDLQTLYGRARCYAPLVNKAFYEKKVPEVVGLYIVMIETEFNNPVTDNQAGAMGMFQFLASTARGYKLQPEDRCDVLKMVKAAADYMNDQMFFFWHRSTEHVFGRCRLQSRQWLSDS